MSRQRVGTLNELSRARRRGRARRPCTRCRRPDTTAAATAASRRARDVDDVRPPDVGDGVQRVLDLARVDGRAAHLEHVVAPAGQEEVAVGVELPEVTGRVEAVVGEHLGARAPADAAHQVRTAQLDLARPRRRRPARRCRGRRSRTSTSAKGRPQLPSLPAGSVWSRRSPQYGPNDSVMPSRFARVAGAACIVGGQDGVEAARPQRGEVGGGEPRVARRAPPPAPASPGTT